MRWKLPFIIGFFSLGAFLGIFTAPPQVVQAQVGPANTILCNQLVFQNTSTGVVQTLLAGSTGKIIAICGWHVTTTTSVSQSFQLISGTGTNCGTTSSIVTPAFQLTSSAPSTDHIEFASLSLASGNNLCVQSSGNANQIGVWVSQF